MVHFLTRHPKGGNQFHWDPAQGQIDEKALVGVEAIINLAGAGIADKRWTQARKALLVESRVQSAALLLKTIGRMKQRPHTYVAASAIGYYGNTGERWCRETDQPADNGFLSECCVQWENANRQAEALGLRTAILRIGVVLSTKGGALPELIKPLRFGVGAYFAIFRRPVGDGFSAPCHRRTQQRDRRNVRDSIESRQARGVCILGLLGVDGFLRDREAVLR